MLPTKTSENVPLRLRLLVSTYPHAPLHAADGAHFKCTSPIGEVCLFGCTVDSATGSLQSDLVIQMSFVPRQNVAVGR